MSHGIPEEGPSKYAAEGTLAHEVCESLLKEQYCMAKRDPGVSAGLSALPDHGAEMQVCAEDYLKVIDPFMSGQTEIGKVDYWAIEKHIPIFPGAGCYGTADFIAIGEKGMVVIDYKYGRGRKVREDSTQLKLYALGCLKGLKLYGEDYKIITVVFQPRISTTPVISEYTTTQIETFEHEVVAAIETSMKTQKGDNLLAGGHCFLSLIHI